LHWFGWLQYFACYSQRILQWWPLCCGWGRCANGSAKATLGTTKGGGGMAAPLPPCLHWYITVVTRRRRNSSKWWHIILFRTSFLGRGRIFSCNSSSFNFFSSPAQEVLPLTNLISPQEKVLIFNPEGVSLLWPLWSLLSHLHLYIFFSSFNPREVPARRCFGFLVIPDLKEIANMER
jgi:hypothetical protein